MKDPCGSKQILHEPFVSVIRVVEYCKNRWVPSTIRLISSLLILKILYTPELEQIWNILDSDFFWNCTLNLSACTACRFLMFVMFSLDKLFMTRSFSVDSNSIWISYNSVDNKNMNDCNQFKKLQDIDEYNIFRIWSFIIDLPRWLHSKLVIPRSSFTPPLIEFIFFSHFW